MLRLITDIFFLFECIALITVVVQYKKLKHSIYRYFLPYLSAIVLYQFGSIFYIYNINNSNLYIANITEIGSFLFYGYFLPNLLVRQSFKKIIRIVVPLTLACGLVNMAFIQGFWKLDTITILMQFAVIIFIVCLYFYELMNSLDDDIVIIKLPGFWLNTGLLFFCLFNFLFFSSFSFLAYKPNIHYIFLAIAVLDIANAILYSCLSVCFLCFNKTTK